MKSYACYCTVCDGRLRSVKRPRIRSDIADQVTQAGEISIVIFGCVAVGRPARGKKVSSHDDRPGAITLSKRPQFDIRGHACSDLRSPVTY
ncbi:hypothetical protein NPIL_177651 [Nephila pilipes]|uniref:Uncharacterized protein n=1 Tax=Nephila pilipes TaxID=299642 RepID=A0A8X6NUX0_NEPPI|nr:hypothetical protein NPIL_177651 [Nephila pilipes]